ncbi:MAG: nucleotidyltransferase family protein [Chloroflexota bacterium]
MIAALLLAAGESTRMGSPKPLLDWGGEPLVSYQVHQLQRSGCGLVVVVLGSRAGRVLPFVEALGVEVVLNPDYAQGRASSVRVGAAVIPPTPEWVLVLGVDQPRPARVIRKVIAAARTSTGSIVMPVYRGRFGHPTAFSGRLLSQMCAVEDATLGLRAVVRRNEKQMEFVEIDDPVVRTDLNTPEDYRRARVDRKRWRS